MADIYFPGMNNDQNQLSTGDIYFPGMPPPAVDPADISSAHQIQQTNPQGFNNYCQTFVEKATGSGWKGQSASDAFNNYQNEGKAIFSPDGMQPGNLVYFKPDASNRGLGHTGIITGNGKFVSATDNGIQEMSLSDWQNKTGQKVAGFVRPESLPKIGGSN